MGLVEPLALDDQGDENVADAGDLLALMTPGSRRFEGDVCPDRGEDVPSPGLR